MAQPLRKRMNKNLNMTAFTDVRLDDVGSAAFVISELNVQDYSNAGNFGHDYFTSQDLTIYTGAGATGTQLVVDTDYTLSEENTTLSTAVTNAVGSTKNVYKKVQVTNATYQTGTLYVNGNWIADDNNCDDLTNVTPLLVAKSVAYTQTDKLGFPIYKYTTGTATKTHTLPTAADNKNARVGIFNSDSSYGPVLIDGEGAETINGLTHTFLWSQYDYIELMSTGSEWIITNDFKPYYYSGWINTSDWTNRHLGFATITYNTLVGTIQVGDKCTGGTNGSYGIVIYDNGSDTCVLASVVGGGSNIFDNTETLAFDLSGATAAVNMASGLKNVDSNVYHGWGTNQDKVKIYFVYSTDGTYANSISPIDLPKDGDLNKGFSLFQIDTDNVKFQTGGNGFLAMQDDGTRGAAVDTEDYYYQLRIKHL